MSNIKPEDIIEFVKNWRSSDEILTEEQITNFVAELQEQVSSMDFSKTYGKTIIGYSGWSNNSKCFEIVDVVCKSSDSNAIYISSLPAGELLGELYRSKLEEAIFDIVENKETVDMIMGGWKNDERVGPLCGYGDYLSLDDFVSAKLMGESRGVSDNYIIFTPEEIMPNKVFAATEIGQLFSNDSCKYINGIPKDQLYTIYNTGEQGKETVFQIISAVSREVVGNTNGISEQAKILGDAISEGGILSKEGADFQINMCYDSKGTQIGIELYSKSKETSVLSDYHNGSLLINGSDKQVVSKKPYSSTDSFLKFQSEQKGKIGLSAKSSNRETRTFAQIKTDCAMQRAVGRASTGDRSVDSIRVAKNGFRKSK